jgi:glycerophosphoryl diester phosphodiesterase
MAQVSKDPYLTLMERAEEHAKAHGAKHTPVLSSVDSSVIGDDAKDHVDTLHATGFMVVSWTTNDPVKMRALIALNADGIISDRPDILQQVVIACPTQSRGGGQECSGRFSIRTIRSVRRLL